MSEDLTFKNLKIHDRKVLESIFNPLEYVSSFDISIPMESELTDEINRDGVDPDDLAQAVLLQNEAVRQAEDGRLEDALQSFADALSKAPHLISVYNNRAQALRLAGRDEEALKDLNIVIPIANYKQKKTKCAALCQRGILYRKQENLDAAQKDFKAAAALGSHFAKTQLVELNPYAAMCSNMLQQVNKKLTQEKV